MKQTISRTSPVQHRHARKFYGVSTNDLLGITETKNHPDTELGALHLSDGAIEG